MKSCPLPPGSRWTRDLLVPAVLLAGLSLFVMTGCEEDPSGPSESDIAAAEALVTEGYQLLAVAFENADPNSGTPADFITAKQKFENALVLDPDNDDARLGLALCEIGLLTQNATLLAALGDVLNFVPFGKAGPGAPGPEFRRVFGDSPGTGNDLLTPGGWLTWMKGRMTKVVQEGDPPDFGPLQDAIEATFIPVVDAVIALLAVIESDPAWNLVLSPTMQGFEELDGQLEIDVTDILLIDAFMHLLKAQLHFFVSYNLNLPDFADDTAEQAALNQTDGTFLTLRTNGAANMAATRQGLENALEKMGAFMLSLSLETDNQDDDLIKPDDLLTGEDQDDFVGAMADLSQALNGAHTIDDIDFDDDGTVDIITVDLSSFFTSPVTDLKQLLPPYYWSSQYLTFLWNGWPEDLSQWVFPDPTMGGLFPDLTTDAALKAFFDIPTDRWVSPGPFFFDEEG